MLKLREILSLRGLDLNARIKIVRHQDHRCDLKMFERIGAVETYQSIHGRPIFHKCQYVISFIGMESRQARLFGVYRVGKHMPASIKHVPPEYRHINMLPKKGGYFYELTAMPEFDDLKHQLVIDWGGSALSWHQWLREKTDKDVVEILPKGYVREFPGYLDFILMHDDLKKIVYNRTAHREWHRMLSAVAGVYLIVDTLTGKQYVGSAYGERGLLARWASYADNGHGGNKQLKALLNKNGKYATNFQFTILETLPRTLTKNEVIARETLHKKKLGSRAYGLNSN